MNTLMITILLVLVATQTFADKGIENGASLAKILEFTETENDDNLAEQLMLIQRTKHTPEAAAQVLCAVLARADKYLSEHRKPDAVPSVNVAPPGGGLAGMDPEAIVDPVERAAYKKAIEENRVLAEAHRKHGSVSKIRDSALRLLAIFHANGTISEAQLTAAVEQQATSKEQKASLLQQVRKAGADKPEQRQKSGE